MKIPKFVITSLFVAFSLIIAGCGDGERNSSPREKTGKQTIAVIPKGMTHEFWKSIHVALDRIRYRKER